MLNKAGVAIEHGDSGVGKISNELGQMRWQHVLGNSGAGPKTQLSYMVLVKQVHSVFELLVLLQDTLAMLHHELTGRGEL